MACISHLGAQCPDPSTIAGLVGRDLAVSVVMWGSKLLQVCGGSPPPAESSEQHLNVLLSLQDKWQRLSCYSGHSLREKHAQSRICSLWDTAQACNSDPAQCDLKTSM
ncbi:hypothetical protein AOLI_G00216740 [Acnodon oligacanthus]